MALSISAINKEIIACESCPRLRKHCLEIARVRRRAYAAETYWGKPITGFGDPRARLVVMGLAPAAHGANRTGRIFTGDRSGDWLYRALHKQGFANQPKSTGVQDGLRLTDCYITCAVKCAPPDNKPRPGEAKNCSRYIASELAALREAHVFLALGQIAAHALWDQLRARNSGLGARPKFTHGGEVDLGPLGTLLLSYHPSQQNTFTGRLTEPMFDRVFARASHLILSSSR